MIKDNYIRVGLALLDPNPWNPNVQTDFMFEKEINSIKENGFLQPILVREKNGRFEIIDGEHRYKAAHKLNMAEVSVNNLGEVPDHVAKQLTIIMNETKGKPNQDKLSELIKSLSVEVNIDELIKNLPYQSDEIQGMISHVEVDWESIKPISPPEKSESSNPIVAPHIENSEYKHDGRVVGEKNGYETLSVKLPVEEMNELKAQISRIKKLMYPENEEHEVEDEHAWIGIIQALIQTKDQLFTGGAENEDDSGN